MFQMLLQTCMFHMLLQTCKSLSTAGTNL
jgi:hypothetical protein